MPSSISLSVLSLGGHRHCSPIWPPVALADLLGGGQVSRGMVGHVATMMNSSRWDCSLIETDIC